LVKKQSITAPESLITIVLGKSHDATKIKKDNTYLTNFGSGKWN
jgi:hypothetical protein